MWFNSKLHEEPYQLLTFLAKHVGNNMPLTTVRTVSYTHLDVYKRQGLTPLTAIDDWNNIYRYNYGNNCSWKENFVSRQLQSYHLRYRYKRSLQHLSSRISVTIPGNILELSLIHILVLSTSV